MRCWYDFSMKDYYKTLEVHPQASLDVLNNAYRTLVRKHHPDVYHTHHKAMADERMREINEAYTVLSNEASRVEYDRRYRQWQRPPHPPSARTPFGTLRGVLLWGVGTYVLLKYLLLPLAANPFMRLMLGLVAAYFIIRLFARSQPPKT